MALATKGTVRLARGFASITNTWLAFTAYCTLIRPRTSSSVAMARVCSSITAMVSGDEGVGREGTGRVARVHAGLLDVLHHPTDDHLARVVTDRVDVDLGGVLEEAVDEHRPLGRQPALLAEAAEVGQVVHGAS